MIDIFGIQLPEPLFYTLIVAGAIFYASMIWLIIQLMRRRMPTRVLKLGLGQSMEEYRCKEDDVKIHWREGAFGRMHEALKVTKERIKTHWGIANKMFLARRDYKLTIPFARSLKSSALKLLNLTEEDLNLVNEFSDDKKPFPLNRLSDKAKAVISILRTKDLDLCDKCKKGIPEYVTVDFMTTDELMGSSTEATSQRRNEDFCDTAVKSLKKIKKGDFLMAFLFGGSTFSLILLAIMIMTKLINLG